MNPMRTKNLAFFRYMVNDERGQALPSVVLAMIGLLGMAGVTGRLARAYVVRMELQNATNAAALAAAGMVYNTSSSTNASTFANNYSSGVIGNKNFDSKLQVVHTSVSTKCLNTLMPNGSGCPGAPDNAVVVTQSTSVPTFFMKLFGFNSVTVSATATSSMQGIAQPWNVAIIVDSTGSM